MRPSDYQPWLTDREWFDSATNLADVYPVAVDNLLGVKRDRRDFFERLVSPPVPPSRGYRSLAKILHQGWIHTVLTTNFDDCVQRAATLENQPHFIARIKTIDDLVMFSGAPAEPQLLFLHGSIEHYSDKNLAEEVQSLDPRIVERVRPLFRDHPVIVVGYRGTERSVMQGLFLDQIKFTNQFAQGIYWCTLEPEDSTELSPFVVKLAEEIGSNFNSVTIEGFDELFEVQLWSLLEAQKTPPARRAAADIRPSPSYDMRPAEADVSDVLDMTLMQARLKEYAEKLRFWVSNDSEWAIDAAERLHLLTQRDGKSVPTIGGLLLFGQNPTEQISCCRLNLRVVGPNHWLRSCFGEGADDEPEDIGETSREITGNLWHQLDELTDVLSLVNFTFRLKGELSKQVQAYNPIAIKEAIVNALVHRDYQNPAAIDVLITPKTIVIDSPGGLTAEVRAETGGVPLEELIKSDRRGIKGYRNPVISDLFYGGGQMDRAGSGLSDLWQTTINNNGDVSFGPDPDNAKFTVELHARPEAVDEVTNTALARTQQTHRFSANILPFVQIPPKVWCAATTVATMRGLRARKHSDNLPGGYLHNSTFYTFFDLDRLSKNRHMPFQRSGVFTRTTEELLAIPNGRVVFVKLLNEALFEHFRAIGLWIDYPRKRVHFTKPDDADERRVTYQARVRKATRTVVKARKKRNGEGVAYYEHKALGFLPIDFGDDWALMLSPGYTFTRDGAGKPIGRERINVLSTRRAAKDFNQSVHQDVAFWIAVLCGEVTGVFALTCRDDIEAGAPTILLSSRPPTVSYGSDSFAQLDDEWGSSVEFDDLEDEIMQLAQEEDADTHSDLSDVEVDEEDE